VDHITQDTPPRRRAFVAEGWNDESGQAAEKVEMPSGQTRNQCFQNSEIRSLQRPLSRGDFSVDRNEKADLPQRPVQVHRLYAEDERPWFGRLEQVPHGSVEVVEHVMKHVVDPDHVERSLRQIGRVQRRANEFREVGHAVDRSALSGQLHRGGRHVEPGHSCSELRENHRVLALATANVQDPLAREIARRRKQYSFG